MPGAPAPPAPPRRGAAAGPGRGGARAEAAGVARHERSWSIQDSLDQHVRLEGQREALLGAVGERLRERARQRALAESEVEAALGASRALSAWEAADAPHVRALAGRVCSAVRDLRTSCRLQQMERDDGDRRVDQLEAEIEKSRREMTTMKEVIEDPALFVAVEDSQTAAPVPVDLSGKPLRQKYFYCTNCRVGGHGQRYCEYFLERPDWRVYPSQTWFEDDQKGIEYHCPLGKKLVDFADESHFSRIAMYLRGRVWLEGKTNVLQICDESVMPKTYIIERGQWSGDPPPHDDQVADLPWFVKESDRNWGTSVHLCGKPSECLRLAKPDATYVVQQHVADPLLLDDGRKCHIKFYVLLTSMEDGVTWRVYTYREGYLSISPNVWSPGDLSKETQVTIIRSERSSGWKAWPDAYPKCKAAVARIIRKAVTDGKLEGRLGKKQFEIFSADFMMDIHGKAWFFEFNMSPVLKDPKDEPRMNDAEMIRAALHVVCPYEGGSAGLWDCAGEFRGVLPQPKAAPSAGPPRGGAHDAP